MAREIFQNLIDKNTKDVQIDMSGLRAFGRTIGYARKQKRKIGFLSKAQKNRRKVIQNILRPAEGETERQPLRNPVSLAMSDTESVGKIVGKLGAGILEAANQSAQAASKIDQNKQGFFKTQISKPIKDLFNTAGSEIKELILQKFDDLPQGKVQRLEKDTTGLVETGQLRASIKSATWGVPFKKGHYARKMAR